MSELSLYMKRSDVIWKPVRPKSVWTTWRKSCKRSEKKKWKTYKNIVLGALLQQRGSGAARWLGNYLDWPCQKIDVWTLRSEVLLFWISSMLFSSSKQWRRQAQTRNSRSSRKRRTDGARAGKWQVVGWTGFVWAAFLAPQLIWWVDLVEKLQYSEPVVTSQFISSYNISPQCNLFDVRSPVGRVMALAGHSSIHQEG